MVSRIPAGTSILDLINPQPKQCEFLLAVRLYKYVCYGGAAGGGKSYISRWWLLLFCIEAFVRFGMRGVIVGMFCETYDALRGRQISKIATDPKFKRFGELKGTQEIGYAFHIKEQFGGGKILFKNLDDPSKYDSLEFAAIAIDEYTKNPAKTVSGNSVFNELRKRLRWTTDIEEPHFPCGGYKKNQGRCPIHEGQPRFILPLALFTNPGGPSHAEVKALWVDSDFTDYPNLAKHKHKFKFIRALSTDNKYNPDDYVEELNTLPEDMRKAYAEGDWNVFSGQFYKEWRDQYHIVSDEELATTFRNGIPKDWKKACSMDHGYSPDPAYNGWFATAPDGTVYLYREDYDVNKTPQEHGKQWLQLSEGENIAYRLGDPSIKAKESTGQSPLNMYHEAGWDILLANNDRAAGYLQMHRYLGWKADENGKLIVKPKFRVFPNCKYAIRTIPAQMHDKHKINLMAPGEDHACDAIRYFLMGMPEPAKQELDKLDPRWKEAILRLQHAKNPK